MFSNNPRRQGDSATRLNSVDALSDGARRVAFAQAMLTLLVAVGFAISAGWSDALAAAYGGGVAILISGWHGWRLQRVGGTAGQLAANGLVAMYVGAFQRYAAVFVLMGLGLGVWRLAPLPLLSAFAVSQFGYLARPWRKR